MRNCSELARCGVESDSRRYAIRRRTSNDRTFYLIICMNLTGKAVLSRSATALFWSIRGLPTAPFHLSDTFTVCL